MLLILAAFLVEVRLWFVLARTFSRLGCKPGKSPRTIKFPLISGPYLVWDKGVISTTLLTCKSFVTPAHHGLEVIDKNVKVLGTNLDLDF
ncbi:hypothetical protein Pelo_6445 [Pelomyxa schiedti]|nr:hypothetical protein Pelo_6445 [Pelomyxa schiedti]